MKLLPIFLLTLFFALFFLSGSTDSLYAAPKISTPIYYGAYVADHLDSLSAVSSFETDAKKKLSIIMWYQGWGVTDYTRNFQPTWMNTVRNHGSIPMITWEPWNYTKGINQPDYSLAKIINGSFDSYITQWAKDSKAWGHPYFLRFAHEMNGDWYPWSEHVNGNSTGQYVVAWRHVHDIFVANGATNVTWVWTPNVVNSSTTPLSQLFPGDSYVDWIGMDGYNFGTTQSWSNWISFTDLFTSTYTQLISLSSKPIIVSETASTEQGGNKASWITNSYGQEISNFSKIKAILWFNQNRETDWRIESSFAATSAFSQAVSSSKYTSNNYFNLNKSPIPVP